MSFSEQQAAAENHILKMREILASYGIHPVGDGAMRDCYEINCDNTDQILAALAAFGLSKKSLAVKAHVTITGDGWVTEKGRWVFFEPEVDGTWPNKYQKQRYMQRLRQSEEWVNGAEYGTIEDRQDDEYSYYAYRKWVPAKPESETP